MFSTGTESLGELSPEGLLLTQNPTGSVSALPVSLPAGTLRGGVYDENHVLHLSVVSQINIHCPLCSFQA